VAPRPRHPFLDGAPPRAFAHRGGTETAPENTLEAFAHAVSLGVRYLETDVHLTADGGLVAFHDERLDRVTDRAGAIADLPLAEVRAAVVGDGGRVPTLDELLEAFPGARFNIDAKHDDVVVALAQTLRRHDALDRVCVGAFSDDRLRRVRELLGPDCCTSAGPAEVARAVAASRLPLGAPSSVPPYRCLQVPVEHRGVAVVTPALVELAHRRDCEVHVWTIDDPAEMDRLLDLGVDGIMTDRPTALVEVLDRRGAWT
jgi:glycerophosphoryl diester phosphodiesterase